MSFPPAHVLVGAGAADVAAGALDLPRWRAWALGAVVAVGPDLDILVGMALDRGAALHGTFSHSVAAVVVAGLLVTAFAGRRWGLLTALCYATHPVVDLLDARGRTNVELAWPFSRADAVAIEPVFPQVEFAHGSGWRGAFRSLFTPEVAEQVLRQTLVGLGVFALLLGVGWMVRRARGARGASAGSR